jgi:hypothetical protein
MTKKPTKAQIAKALATIRAAEKHVAEFGKSVGLSLYAHIYEGGMPGSVCLTIQVRDGKVFWNHDHTRRDSSMAYARWDTFAEKITEAAAGHTAKKTAQSEKERKAREKWLAKHPLDDAYQESVGR